MSEENRISEGESLEPEKTAAHPAEENTDETAFDSEAPEADDIDPVDGVSDEDISDPKNARRRSKPVKDPADKTPPPLLEKWKTLWGIEMFRLTFVLFVITAAVSLLLSVVYNATADTIERNAAEARMSAQRVVMPEANSFVVVEGFEKPRVLELNTARDGERLVGYTVSAYSPNGFGGNVEIMVGIDLMGGVAGVVVTDCSGETPGLGSEAQKPAFLNQFLGRGPGLSVGNSTDGIVAITGATITSKAVTEAVNAALSAVADYQAGG